MSRLTLIHSRYVVPMRPSRVVLENHCVVVKGNLIIDLLPSDVANTRFESAEQVHLNNHVLLPGLINMHTHSPMTLMRGYADDLDLQVWLKDHIWPVENRFVSPQFVADGTRLAIAEMLRAGTTCFNDNYFFPDIMADVTIEAGMRACIGLPIIELATAWAESVDEYLAKAVGLLVDRETHPEISWSLAPHAPYSVSDETLTLIGSLSTQFDVPIHMHLMETQWDARHSSQVYGLSPLQRLKKLNLLNPKLIAVHMTQLTQEDIRQVAAAGLQIIHCPQSNLKLASGLCPIAELRSAAVNIAIGTDGAASNNNLDLLSEAQTAALLAKGSSGDPSAVDAFAALEMITINGAIALGMENQLGSIEVGKQADLAALDLHAPETQPMHNVISQLIYAASSRQFSDVWVAGNRLLNKGRLTSLDLSEVLSAAEKWRQKLSDYRSTSKDVQAGLVH
jgi:5-methylthioadenosine/S-adenosylhomocysteine deaminase